MALHRPQQRDPAISDNVRGVDDCTCQKWMTRKQTDGNVLFASPCNRHARRGLVFWSMVIDQFLVLFCVYINCIINVFAVWNRTSRSQETRWTSAESSVRGRKDGNRRWLWPDLSSTRLVSFISLELDSSAYALTQCLPSMFLSIWLQTHAKIVASSAGAQTPMHAPAPEVGTSASRISITYAPSRFHRQIAAAYGTAALSMQERYR